MKKVTIAALLMGLAAGFGAGRLSRPRTQTDVAPPAPAASSQSGPGLSCPAAAPEEVLASQDPAEAAGGTGQVSGALCSVSTQVRGHLILDGAGDPQLVPEGDAFWFAYYKGLPPTPMGNGSLINGAVMHVAQLATTDSPNEVLAFYRRQFEANRITPVGALLEGLSGPYTMSIPKAAKEPMRTLTLVPSHDTTVVLASVGSPDMDKAAELPDDFPAPKGMRQVRVDTIQDGNTEQRNMSFVAPGTVEEVRSFYLKQLPGMGFSDEDMPWKTDYAEVWSHTFRRGDESLSMNLNKRTDKAVQVTVLWVAAAPAKEQNP